MASRNGREKNWSWFLIKCTLQNSPKSSLKKLRVRKRSSLSSPPSEKWKYETISKEQMTKENIPHAEELAEMFLFLDEFGRVSMKEEEFAPVKKEFDLKSFEQWASELKK